MLAATRDGVGAAAAKHEREAGRRPARHPGICLSEAVEADLDVGVIARRGVDFTSDDDGSAAQDTEIRQTNDYPAVRGCDRFGEDPEFLKREMRVAGVVMRGGAQGGERGGRQHRPSSHGLHGRRVTCHGVEWTASPRW